MEGIKAKTNRFSQRAVTDELNALGLVNRQTTIEGKRAKRWYYGEGIDPPSIPEPNPLTKEASDKLKGIMDKKHPNPNLKEEE